MAGKKSSISNDIVSPCIGVCTIDDDMGLCLGCARNLDEVARWRRLSHEQKNAVMQKIPDRKREMIVQGVDIRWRT